MIVLHIVDGFGQELDVPVLQEEGFLLTMGRSPECDIAITEDTHLSRIHCNIGYWGGMPIIRDCGSSNGIYLDGERISEGSMEPGRIYQLGNCTITCTYRDDDNPILPPVPQEEGTPVPRAIVVESATPQYILQQQTKEEPQPEAGAEPAGPAPLPPSEPGPVPPSEPGFVPLSEPGPVPPSEPGCVTGYEEEVLTPPEAAEPELPPIELTMPGKRVRKLAKPAASAPRSFRNIPSGGAESRLKKPAHAVRKTITAPGGAPRKTRSAHAAAAPLFHQIGQEGLGGQALGLPEDFPLRIRLASVSGSNPSRLQFALRAEADCYLHLIQYDESGDACVIFPYGPQKKRPHLYHGIETLFPPPRRAAYDFVVEEPLGRDTIVALACTGDIRLTELLNETLAAYGSRPGLAEAAAIEQATRKSGREARWSSCVICLSTTQEGFVVPPHPEEPAEPTEPEL